METRITEIAQRIRALREIMGFSEEEVAEAVGISVEDYRILEAGATDFSVTVLGNCAEKFGVDLIELMTGENPHLSRCSIVRKGKGLQVNRREGFTYEHMAYSFKNKIAEPFVVTAPYQEEEQEKPIHLSTHEGQEMDFILSGQLKVVVGDQIEVLNPGDVAYYDSSKPHGMIAVGGEDCVFLAVVMKQKEAEVPGK